MLTHINFLNTLFVLEVIAIQADADLKFFHSFAIFPIDKRYLKAQLMYQQRTTLTKVMVVSIPCLIQGQSLSNNSTSSWG